MNFCVPGAITCRHDKVNEILETDAEATPGKLRSYIHGISYVDERLMMMDYETAGGGGAERPYYYVIDRMYNVRALVDRAGALIERYVYDPYGRPLIRECAGRGDLWGPDSELDTYDDTLVDDAIDGTIWDARADMDDDGDFDAADQTAYDAKEQNWYPTASPTVAEAFSDVGNPFMFQGRPHYALDTEADVTEATLMLNDHRARFADPGTGRWTTRDPLLYNGSEQVPLQRGGWLSLYELLSSNPGTFFDPSGLVRVCTGVLCDTRALVRATPGPMGMHCPDSGVVDIPSRFAAICVVLHEGIHVVQQDALCRSAQQEMEKCNRMYPPREGDIMGAVARYRCWDRVEQEWNDYITDPCVVAHDECEAYRVSHACFSFCSSFDDFCCGELDTQLRKLKDECGKAATCTKPPKPLWAPGAGQSSPSLSTGGTRP